MEDLPPGLGDRGRYSAKRMVEPMKQFDIAPAGELRDRMKCALPAGQRLEWHAVGGLDVGVSGISIGDPYVIPEFETLPFPEGLALLDGLVIVDEHDEILYVAGFKITAEDANPTSIRKSEDLDFSIDSARAYVGCIEKLQTHWRPHEDDMSWQDLAELQDDLQCSLDELLEKSELAPFAVLANDQNSPFLYSFPSGLGDGVYLLDELHEDDKIVGYFATFMDAE